MASVYDNCALLNPAAFRAPYETDVEIYYCYSKGLQNFFSKSFGELIQQADQTYQAKIINRGEFLNSHERVGWWAMFHFLERAFAGADASTPSTETCAIKYFIEHMSDVYDDVPYVHYMKEAECLRTLDKFMNVDVNQAKVKVISDMFSGNIRKKAPNDRQIVLPSDPGFKWNHEGLFDILSAACQQPQICSVYTGYNWIVDGTAWILFTISFSGSSNVGRFKKLVNAGVGPSATKTIKAPADGTVFSYMQNILTGHLDRSQYSILLTKLDILVNTLPSAYQGIKNMLTQCKYNGMTGFVIVQECLQAHMGEFPFEVLFHVWAQEYSDMCACFKAASLPNGGLNPYYMFALGSEKTEYTATMFKRFVIVCAQIQIQVDGKQSIAQYARGRNMNELGSYQVWVQKEIDKMKTQQTGLLDGSVQKVKKTYADFMTDVASAQIQ